MASKIVYFSSPLSENPTMPMRRFNVREALAKQGFWVFDPTLAWDVSSHSDAYASGIEHRIQEVNRYILLNSVDAVLGLIIEGVPSHTPLELKAASHHDVPVAVLVDGFPHGLPDAVSESSWQTFRAEEENEAAAWLAAHTDTSPAPKRDVTQHGYEPEPECLEQVGKWLLRR